MRNHIRALATLMLGISVAAHAPLHADTGVGMAVDAAEQNIASSQTKAGPPQVEVGIGRIDECNESICSVQLVYETQPMTDRSIGLPTEDIERMNKRVCPTISPSIGTRQTCRPSGLGSLTIGETGCSCQPLSVKR